MAGEDGREECLSARLPAGPSALPSFTPAPSPGFSDRKRPALKQDPMKYDLIVIGAGSGGVASANRAAQHGARCALIEQDRLGGTCVNRGCVPKKIMWHAAGLAHATEDSVGYGFAHSVPELDWGRLRAGREGYIERLNGIYAANLEKNGVTVFHGHGRIQEPGRVEAGTEEIEGENILIATGGAPVVPDIEGAELGITSDGFFAFDHCPRRIAIVGAGYIAVELAGMLQALGARVSLLLRRDRPLRRFDSLIADGVASALAEDGVELHRHTHVRRLRRAGGNLEVGSEQGAIGPYDEVLWAIGRRPATAGLGLDSLGIELDKRGQIPVDDWQATSAAGVYAIGDVTGRAPLTPVAIAAGRRLADRLFGGQSDSRLDYELIPSVIFSHPPAGSIGLSEEQARRRHGPDVKVYSSEFTPLYHALTPKQKKAAVKLIVSGPEERIVGCHALGQGADEMMQGFAVALRLGATKRDFDETVAIHPTTAEELVTLRGAAS